MPFESPDSVRRRSSTTCASGIYDLSNLPAAFARFVQMDPRQIGALVTVWVATALVYPTLRRGAFWFVDVVVLHRPVPSLAAVRARRPAALLEPLREPLRAELDGLGVTYVPFLAPFFDAAPLTAGDWMAMLPFCFASPVAMELLKISFRGRKASAGGEARPSAA